MRRMGNLSQNWKIVKLDEISSTITKGSTPTTYGFKYLNSGIPFVKVENINGGKIIKESINRYISKEAHEFQKRSKLQNGDILFSIAGTIGRVCLVSKKDIPANTNQALAIIRGTGNYIAPEFLKIQLDSHVSQHVKSKARGGAMNNISLSDLKHMDIVLPPIKEQELITQEIETQFTRLDAAIKSLKTIKKNLDVYRNSVLKAAFEGNFTNDEGKKTIDTLGFQLRMPKSWNIGKLSDLGDYSRGKSKHRPRNDPILYKHGKYPFIQTGEISNANRLVKSYRKMYNDTGLKQSKLWPKGTLCITIAANIAKTAILDFDACFPDSVIGFNSKAEKSILFVMYYIQLLQQILDVKASATAQKNINIGTFERISFPNLDDDLQEQIVQEIESRFSVIDKLEQTINKALIKANQLRKSILKSAFEGKLVKYEGDNND